MINFKRHGKSAIKITIVVLMMYTFSMNTSLSALQASLVNSDGYVNKHNQYFKQEPFFGRLRKNFNLTTQFMDMRHVPEVQKHFKKFNQSKNAFIKTTILARSDLYYILEQVEKRKLPGELVLLPMLESNLQTQAISNRGAVGLWQFMPGTAKQFGLKWHAGYDGRKDVKASTKAALNYLEYLHKKFNYDWMLTLAAYNAGEGTVERAIKRNKKAGKPTSFWFLKLPKQTREYVPKFLALTQMIH